MTGEQTGVPDLAQPVQVAGHVDGVPGPLVLASGAVHDERRASAGFLATSGHFGVQAYFYDPQVLGERRTLIVQLLAVLAGLNHLDGRVPYGTPTEVSLDHEGALTFLEEWARGRTVMPDGYRIWRLGVAASPLERLRQMVARHAAALTFSHQPAHAGRADDAGTAGGILRLAAQSLASLGLRSCKGQIPTDALPGVAAEYARQDLTAYVRLPLARPGARTYSEPCS